MGEGNNSEYLGDNTARHELLISNSLYVLIQMKHGKLLLPDSHLAETFYFHNSAIIQRNIRHNTNNDLLAEHLQTLTMHFQYSEV